MDEKGIAALARIPLLEGITPGSMTSARLGGAGFGRHLNAIPSS